MANKIPRVPVREQDPQIRATNFEEVCYGYDLDEARLEASRCLHCRNPRCVAACPVSIRIPDFIGALHTGELQQAADIIAGDSSLPSICGRVCPQESQCEGSCILGIKGEPVAIGKLERFIGDWKLEHGAAAAQTAPRNGYKVAVIGSGPAGLACASDLAKLGYEVKIFEALHKAGGVLVYGIPEFRLPKERIVAREIAEVEKLGVEIETDVIVGRTVTIDSLLDEEGYAAVFIGSGAGLPRFMGIPGENANGVFSANEYLTRSNLMKAFRDDYDTPIYLGKKVAIVGGGNVAMDCARSAIRCLANESTVIYRRRQIDMTALPSEIQGAIEEGVELLPLNAPVKINADAEGNVCGFVAQPQIISVYDKQGKPSVTVANKPEIEVPCEVVLMAIGQDIVSAPYAVYVVIPRRKTFETFDTSRLMSYDKIFSGGDCVFGPATVIKAIGAGKVAALNIDEYLGYHHKYLEDIKIPEPRENDRTHYGRVHLTDRSARERKNNFEPVENGMSYDEAMQECGKCLRCDHFGCGVVEGGRV